MKHATRLVTGLAASLLAVGAYAGDYGKKASFESLDADGDGKISATEAAAHGELSAKLAQLDTDGDGALSREEFAALAAADESKPTRTAESDEGEKERTTGTEEAPTVAPTPPTTQQ